MKMAFKISLFIIPFLLISGCINTNSDTQGNENNTPYKSYKISITSDSNNDYTIYLPVVLKNTTEESIIINEKNQTYMIINTIYGSALEIVTKGNFSLFLESTKFEDDELGLSMREIITNEGKPTLNIWVYYNGTGFIELDLEYYSKYTGGSFSEDKEWCQNIHINKNGWNQIEMNALSGGV